MALDGISEVLQIAKHDAFRFGGGLNKSAAEVYWRLLQQPMSVTELIKTSGRSRRTIFRVLRKMSSLIDIRTGEYVSMVQSNNGIWRSVKNVNLDLVAEIIGTNGIGEKKAQQYKIEQMIHKKSLFVGQKK